MRLATAPLIAATCLASRAPAQSEYRDTDAGRPLRVEDAAAVARHAVELQFVPLRVEHTDAGARRWRLEPKVVYGALAHTELELRATIAHQPLQPGIAFAHTGMNGLGVGILHAFGVETPTRPAVALAVETVLPVGSLAAPDPVYAVKGMLTRTTRVARLHLNGSLGTWSVVAPASFVGCGPGLVPLPGAPPCDAGAAGRFVPDLPCSVGVVSGAARASVRCGAPNAAQEPLMRARDGRRWFAGVAADRALAVPSVLLSVETYVERFEGLSTGADWVAEAGVRHQWSPRVVLDAGVGRRFAGTARSTIVTLGAAFSGALRPLVH